MSQNNSYSSHFQSLATKGFVKTLILAMLASGITLSTLVTVYKCPIGSYLETNYNIDIFQECILTNGYTRTELKNRLGLIVDQAGTQGVVYSNGKLLFADGNVLDISSQLSGSGSNMKIPGLAIEDDKIVIANTGKKTVSLIELSEAIKATGLIASENEDQILSISGNRLAISNGNSVRLPVESNNYYNTFETVNNIQEAPVSSATNVQSESSISSSSTSSEATIKLFSMGGTVAAASSSATPGGSFASFNVATNSVGPSANIGSGDVLNINAGSNLKSNLNTTTKTVTLDIIDTPIFNNLKVNNNADLNNVNITGNTNFTGPVTFGVTPTTALSNGKVVLGDIAGNGVPTTLDTTIVPEGLNKYFTNARVISSLLTGFSPLAGTVLATDTVLQSIQKLQGTNTVQDGSITTLNTNLATTNTNLATTNTNLTTTTNGLATTNTNLATTNTNVTNNTAAITALQLPSNNPVTINATPNGLSVNGSQVLSLATAGLSTTGALTGADFTTFNNKVSSVNAGTGTSITGTATAPIVGVNYGTTAGTALQGNTFIPGALLTGFVSSAGTVTALDSLLQAVQKLQGTNTAQDATISTITTGGVSHSPATIGTAPGLTIGAGQVFNLALDTSLIPENTNLYFTNARVISSLLTGFSPLAGTVLATDTVLQSIQKLQGTNTAQDGSITTLNTNLATTNTNLATTNTNLATTNTNVTNNTTAITALQLPANNPVTINATPNGLSVNGSQVLSLATAGLSTTGALTGADFTTFNNKVSSVNAGTGTTITGTAIAPIVGVNYGTTAGTALQGNTFIPGALLTGFTSTTGSVTAADSILNAIQKLQGTKFNTPAGTTSQYLRGDGTTATLDTSVVPENTNLYFTNARAIASVLTGFSSLAGNVLSSDTILQAIQKLQGTNTVQDTSISTLNTNLTTTNTNVTNNTNAITALQLPANNPVTIVTPNGLSINATQGLSLATADISTTGALTSTDWNTFIGKQNALTVSNGLTLSGSNLTLGGALTGATNITNSGFGLNITGSTFSSLFDTTGKVRIGTQTGALTAFPFEVQGGDALVNGARIGTVNNTSNTVVGKNALTALTTGTNNSGFGLNSLSALTTGLNNNAFGVDTLKSTISGSSNSAFGHQVLTANLGSSNSGFGILSLTSNTSGGDNSAFGGYSLRFNTSGINNSAFGTESLTANIIGQNNSAFGRQALFSNTADNNNAFGYTALRANTGGTYNNAFGISALFSNTTGALNNAFGKFALRNNITGSENSAFGNEALNLNLSSNQSAFGSLALRNNTVGTNNNAFGYSALTSNIDGTGNNAFGNNALQSNANGQQNSAFGDQSLQLNIASANSAFGYWSLKSNTGGSSNNAFGSLALSSNTNGTDNNAFGFNALSTNTTGSGNNAFGTRALRFTTTGTGNNAYGVETLFNNTIGYSNNAYGSSALRLNIDGFENNAFGVDSLRSNTTGNNNSAFGNQSLYNNTTGVQNTAIGSFASFANLTGSSNVSVGFGSMRNAIGGFSNTAVGVNSLRNNTAGNENTALGNNAMQFNSTGQFNVGIGSFALNGNALGSSNVGIGYKALTGNNTGDNNVGIGREVLGVNTTGLNNSALGWLSLSSNNSGLNNTGIGSTALSANTTGSYNIGLGNSSGQNSTTGSNNIYIGNGSGPTLGVSANLSNNIFIGQSAGNAETNSNRLIIDNGTDANPVLIYGDFANARVGINTASPDQTFSVNGSASKVGGGSWVSFSDRRLKKNITNFGLGLQDILAINPVTFQFNGGAELAPDDGQTRVGIIAQDLAQTNFGQYAITTSENGYLQYNSDSIIYGVINAIKEQEAKRVTNEVSQGLVLNRVNLLERDVTTIKAELSNQQNTVNVTQGSVENNLFNQVTRFLSDIWVQGTAFIQNLIVKGTAVFQGRVSFEDRDAAGIATITAGTTEVAINFAKPFGTVPVINVTGLDHTTPGFVKELSTTGFKINIAAPQTQNIRFNWTALDVKNAGTSVSVLSSSSANASSSSSSTSSSSVQAISSSSLDLDPSSQESSISQNTTDSEFTTNESSSQITLESSSEISSQNISVTIIESSSSSI
jgi:hypothetical protein